jgi:hypothetical protein
MCEGDEAVDLEADRTWIVETEEGEKEETDKRESGIKVRNKGKGHSITGHEGPRGGVEV